MDMRAYLLPCFCRAKDSDNWYLRFFVYLRWFDIAAQDRIELRGSSLIVIYAIQSNSEEIHNEDELQSGG